MEEQVGEGQGRRSVSDGQMRDEGNKRKSSPLAHDFGNCVPNSRSRFLNLLLGESDSNTHLEGGRDNLLGLEVVFESFQACDEDAIGQTLQRS